jgi:hypothetical protein
MKRCKCGNPIRASARFCRECAVDYAAGFDTDSFEKADAELAKETTRKFNPNEWQAIPKEEIDRALEQQAEQKRLRFWRFMLVGFLIISVIFSLALFVAIFGSRG